MRPMPGKHLCHFRWMLCAVLMVSMVGCATIEKSGKRQKTTGAPKLQKGWQVSLGIGAKIQPRSQLPVEDGEHLFVCDANRVLALNSRNGKRKWVTHIESPLTGCLALFADQLYVIDKNGFAYALQKEDGSILWQSQIGAESFVAPAANADVLLVHTANEKLQAINPYDGELLWVYDAYNPSLTVRGGFPPILVGPYAVAGFADGSLVILDWRNGDVVSFRQLSVPTGITDIERLVDIDAALLGENNILYVSTYGGSLIAVNLASGKERWRQNLGSSLPLADDAQNIYGIDLSNNVLAFRKSNGSLLWQTDTPATERITGIAVVDDYVFLTNDDGYISALSQEDGSILQRKRISIVPVTVLLSLNDGKQDGVITLDGEGFISFWIAKERSR